MDRLHQFCTAFLIVCTLVFAGCPSAKSTSESENKLRVATTDQLRLGIQEFDGFIRSWKKRAEDGTWDKMVADGSYKKLMAKGQEDSDPKTYPTKRIAELEAAKAKMMAELNTRKD